jgi:hypothetical protein
MYWFQVPSYPASDALGTPQSMKLRMLPSIQRRTFLFQLERNTFYLQKTTATLKMNGLPNFQATRPLPT